MKRSLTLVLAAAALLSCRKREPSPQVMMIPSHQESASPGASPEASTGPEGSVEVAGVSFSAPAQWRRETPSSPMRAAQFSLPGAGNEKDGLFVVYFFGGGQGGSVEENIRRWKGQFADSSGRPAEGSVRTDRRNGLPVTIVMAAGTYSSGLPMGPSAPEPNSELWGAIVEGPQGNVFFKATGPKSTIERSKAGFETVLASLKSVSTSM
ncbi:MAG: hypothetical protein ACRD16_02250 [Thermoanaerobaculia bacterium]